MIEPWPELIDLAKEANITTEDEIEKARRSQIDPVTFQAEIEAPFYELQKRKYIEIVEVAGYGKLIKPTIKGIDDGCFLMRSWIYRKIWHPIKKDVRTIVVGMLAAAGGGIILYLVSKWLGWIKCQCV